MSDCMLFASRGSELFPLRAVSCCMKNDYHIRGPPLDVNIFITHVRNCVMGAAPMLVRLCFFMCRLA